MTREEVLDTYKRLVEPLNGIEIKGKKTPYTAINGNMFSFLDDQDRLCLRFSEARKAELNTQFGTTDVIQYGAVMRGYVAIPSDVVGQDAHLADLFREALDFGSSLKPKPTKE